jgi:hypothetical protein
VGEAELEREVAQRRELVGVDPTAHWEMLARRLQVLAEGEDLDAGLADARERRSQLGIVFPEPEHEPGLDATVVRAAIAAVGRAAEQIETSLELAARPRVAPLRARRRARRARRESRE